MLKFIHVRNLEKFHPGYRDRELKWAKIYFNLVQGDPETEMLNEIDRARLIWFILLELQARKPIPLDDEYLRRKGFDLKKRSISLTLKMLQNFIDVVTEDSKLCTLDKDKEEEEDKEKDKEAVTENDGIPFEIFWRAYDKKVGMISKLEKKWYKLKNETRLLILKHIELYKKSQPEKKYRKNPETYLNNEAWNDEIIWSEHGTTKPVITESELRAYSEAILKDDRFK